MNILHKLTRRILAKNKIRTGVTVIGILLSAAMFTAVTTCVSSMQHFLLRTVEVTDGKWHGACYGADAAMLASLDENKKVRDYTALERIGYAEAGSTNEYKPYLMVMGIDDQTAELLPVQVFQGRMPENGGEILLPAHLRSNGEVYYELGETVTLELGERWLEGGLLSQQNPFQEEETFIPRESRTYTVVGFYQRPTFEDYTAPGYTALTVSEGAVNEADVYIRMQSPKEIYALLEERDGASRINTQLLRFTGMSNEGSYNRVLNGLAVILMGIICFGSIALIYNAFSISVSERTKQFGILKTIGATKRQLRGSVLYEALFLSAIGIPLGIGSGILGIYITLRCTRGFFDTLIGEYGISLELYVSLPAVLIAAAICLITVLISAWIPARRVLRRNAIESVRQSADIAIRAKKIKSPRWVYKLFGFEGLLADKNFKRNRKKYRATVASLFVSVVLFVSASSFCAYLTDASSTAIVLGDYEVIYSINESTPTFNDELLAELEALPAVDGAVYFHSRYYQLEIPEEALTESYLKKRAEAEEYWYSVGNTSKWDGSIHTYLRFLDDTAFRRWVKEQGLDPEDYFGEEAVGIAIDKVYHWNEVSNRYEYTDHIKGEEADFFYYYIPETLNGADFRTTYSKDGRLRYLYMDEQGNEFYYDEEDPIFRRNGRIDGVTEEDPLGESEEYMRIYYPISQRQKVLAGEMNGWTEFQLDTRNAAAAEEQLLALLEEKGLETDQVSNRVEGNESDQALIMVINVFSYGFIILISLIALANVFNTISTNIALRRREFGMLRSVGMTERGLNKMMNFECILYGVKGLSWGLLVAVMITYLIFRVINIGVATEFYLPWYSVAIAVGSVFLVVFATMLYAMRKIKKEDPIKALNSENI